MFNYILKNKDAFETQFGKQEVSGRVMNAVAGLLYAQENQTGNRERAVQIFRQFDPENAGRMILEYDLYYYQINQMSDDFAKTAVELYTKFPSDNWQTLNEIAWSFYETVDNPEHLKAALAWAEKSVELNRNYYNTDTLAALHYKLGNKKKALKWAKEAIKIAKEAGEDASGTEELMKNIKSS